MQLHDVSRVELLMIINSGANFFKFIAHAPIWMPIFNLPHVLIALDIFCRHQNQSQAKNSLTSHLLTILRILKNWPKKVGIEKIEKCFMFSKWPQKLILQSWFKKLFKNAWFKEAKIFDKVLEIQANKKVGKLRRNDSLTWTKKF